MTMKKCSGFHNNALASFDREALSIPAGAATETADKMPMIVISLSRYSKYCFTSILAYLEHEIDFSLDNRMSYRCDGEGLAILEKREPGAPTPGFRQTLATWQDYKPGSPRRSPASVLQGKRVICRMIFDREVYQTTLHERCRG
jgi:hypothetical protein